MTPVRMPATSGFCLYYPDTSPELLAAARDFARWSISTMLGTSCALLWIPTGVSPGISLYTSILGDICIY